MAKLDKQGLNTFIRELDKHINTKINRLNISPTADKVMMADGTSVEEAVSANKTSIHLANENISALQEELGTNKTALSDILTSKKIKVLETDKLSDLISKVELFEDYSEPVLWLYKDGEEFDNKLVEGYSKAGITQSKEIDCLFLHAGGGDCGTRSYICSEKIDLGNYSKAFVEWENIGRNAWPNYSRFQIVDKDDGTNGISQVEVTSVFNRSVSEIDISNLGGFYYIRVLAQYGVNASVQDGSQLKVYKIWLEK